MYITMENHHFHREKLTSCLWTRSIAGALAPLRPDTPRAIRQYFSHRMSHPNKTRRHGACAAYASPVSSRWGRTVFSGKFWRGRPGFFLIPGIYPLAIERGWLGKSRTEWRLQMALVAISSGFMGHFHRHVWISDGTHIASAVGHRCFKDWLGAAHGLPAIISPREGLIFVSTVPACFFGLPLECARLILECT